MWLFGPPNVEKMKAERDVKGLIKALGYQKKWQVREAAADALVKIGALAVQPLIAVLKDSDRDVRGAAAEALGKIGDAHAAPPLTAALEDCEWEVRYAAAEALGKIGDARAVAPLVAAFKDNSMGVSKAAAAALVKFGAAAVEPLTAALKDSNDYVRKAAAEALGKIGDARAVERVHRDERSCARRMSPRWRPMRPRCRRKRRAPPIMSARPRRHKSRCSAYRKKILRHEA